MTRLVSLFADGVRNLREVKLEAHPQLNAFLGPNGVGKTSALEAIHLASALRPLRAGERTRDLIGFNKERGLVKARFDLEGPLPVEVQLLPKGRKATLAGKNVRDISEVAGRLSVVAFVPSDLELVRGSPEHRRRAMDRLAFHLEPGFVQVARDYERALERRNKLLKHPVVDEHQLAAYTGPLVEAAGQLIGARARVVELWRPKFSEMVRAITGERLLGDLKYATKVLEGDPLKSSAQDIAGVLDEKLAVMAAQERQRKTTLAGPHLDDLEVKLGDRRARRIASQGETRALTLALKLAEVTLLTEEKRTAPLFLLDDVAGELDQEKCAFLFETALSTGAQTFVSATHREALPPLEALSVFHFVDGQLA